MCRLPPPRPPPPLRPEIAQRRQIKLREMSIDMGRMRYKERKLLERDIMFGEPVIGLEVREHSNLRVIRWEGGVAVADPVVIVVVDVGVSASPAALLLLLLCCCCCCCCLCCCRRLGSLTVAV